MKVWRIKFKLKMKINFPEMTESKIDKVKS